MWPRSVNRKSKSPDGDSQGTLEGYTCWIGPVEDGEQILERMNRNCNKPPTVHIIRKHQIRPITRIVYTSSIAIKT